MDSAAEPTAVPLFLKPDALIGPHASARAATVRQYHYALSYGVKGRLPPARWRAAHPCHAAAAENALGYATKQAGVYPWYTLDFPMSAVWAHDLRREAARPSHAERVWALRDVLLATLAALRMDVVASCRTRMTLADFQVIYRHLYREPYRDRLEQAIPYLIARPVEVIVVSVDGPVSCLHVVKEYFRRFFRYPEHLLCPVENLLHVSDPDDRDVPILLRKCWL